MNKKTLFYFFSNTVTIDSYNLHKWKLFEGGPQSFLRVFKGPELKRQLVWLYQTETTKTECFTTDEKWYLQMIKLVNSKQKYVTIMNLYAANSMASKIFKGKKTGYKNKDIPSINIMGVTCIIFSMTMLTCSVPHLINRQYSIMRNERGNPKFQ